MASIALDNRAAVGHETGRCKQIKSWGEHVDHRQRAPQPAAGRAIGGPDRLVMLADVFVADADWKR